MKSTWDKPIEVVKEPDACSASRNILFSFPGRGLAYFVQQQPILDIYYRGGCGKETESLLKTSLLCKMVLGIYTHCNVHRSESEWGRYSEWQWFEFSIMSVGIKSPDQVSKCCR